MSMYNMLHGKNPLSGLFCGFLDLDVAGGSWPIGRFRDVHLSDDGSEIIVFTRNGGGNREHWDDEKEQGPECDCPACVMSYRIPNHPQYVRDYDDDFDCTYAYIVFRAPEEAKELCAALATGEDPATVHERFTKTIDEMNAMSPEDLRTNPRTKGLVEMMETIAGKLK